VRPVEKVRAVEGDTVAFAAGVHQPAAPGQRVREIHGPGLEATLRNITLSCFAALLAVVSSAPAASQQDLWIEPVFQESPVWCWAAVGEMVFRYYDVPNINPVGNFQCGIVALLGPVCNQNCGACQVPAGSIAVMNNMLRRYPAFAERVTGHPTGTIVTRIRNGPLSPRDLIEALDEGRPIVAGISPSGFGYRGVSEHVALIVGYDYDYDDELVLLVNDPFPYDHPMFAALGNPFVQAGGTHVMLGQYAIHHRNFVRGLQWRESIIVQCRGDDCP